jgi:carbamoyl-phosphate synthase large subunit
VWLRATRGAGSRAALPVRNTKQADGWLDYWADHAGLSPADFMVSEFLPGTEFAWQSVWWHGRLVTSMARERVEYLFGSLMPSGQSSSPAVARTVNRADVNEVGTAAVRAVMPEPHGVFCVDLKSAADGTPRVTEINAGRFFTTSNFFAHAGLNMPAMYLRLATGEQPPSDLPAYDPLPANLYWVRMVDMGYRLVPDGAWSAREA